MDNSVLTEQRRETVINLLKGMKIKKTDGDGFDKDDVYLCMQQLCDVYEKSIDDLSANYDEQIAELQDKYQKYDENNELYISLIMEAKKSSNEIISKAKAEVDEILANGKEEIARQEAEIEQVKKAAEQERANLKAATELAREEADREKAAIADEVKVERERAEMAKQSYKNRIEAMEQEFEEIKTNILRTAGKIDGLKAQTEENDQAYQWDIREDENRIDIPEPDISIEETIEADEPAIVEVAQEPEIEEFKPAEAEKAEDELTFDDLVAKLENEEFGAGETAEVAEAEIELPDVPETIEEIELPEIEPAVEVPAAEPAVEVPVEAAEVSIDEAFPQEPVGEEVKLEDLDDLASEDLTIELPAETAEAKVEPELPIEEISFEGLEELFKE